MLWKAYEQEVTGEDADVRGVLERGWPTSTSSGSRRGLDDAARDQRAGRLSGDAMWPIGDAYLAKLRKLLAELGYAGKG